MCMLLQHVHVILHVHVHVHVHVTVCRAYLSSSDVSEILAGQRQALAGIDVLRKICNHPDLLQRTQAQGSTTYGEPSRWVGCVLGAAVS
jgi:hypothetical protein